MIIDSHQHAYWHKRDADGLVQDLDACGIDCAWLLSVECSRLEQPFLHDSFVNPTALGVDGGYAGLPLVDQLRARDRHPTRFVLGYSPHPLLGDAAARLETAVAMYGVRICGEWKCNLLLDDPRCLRLFHAAGRLKCPVVVHLDVPFRRKPRGKLQEYHPEWYGGTIANLERVLAACPETIFLGHGPGFWREISGDADRSPDLYPKGPVTPGGRLPAALRRHPNLYGDLSAGSGLNALQRDRTHARRFLAAFSDRLLFARDQYGRDHQEFLAALELSAAVRRGIFGGNAQRLVAPPAGATAKGESP